MFEFDDGAQRKRIAADLTELCEANPWMVSFLIELRTSGTVRSACEAAGITRKVAYHFKNAYPEFSAAWEDAIADAVDGVERVAFRRALDGSDAMIMFTLRAHRPELYDRRMPPRPTGMITIDYNGHKRDVASLDELSTDELRAGASGELTITGDVSTFLGNDADIDDIADDEEAE